MVLATVTVIAASVYLLSGHLSTKDTKHIVPFSIIRKTVDLECYIFADVKVSKLEAIDERSIFLVASACAPISARKACAIESAAISHPNWIVHVVIYGHTWIKRFHNIKGFVSKLQAYQNIVITKIVLPEYFAGTPLESLMTLESIKEIEFPEYFMSDLVKIATLYNHGGVYLSWDVIVERSFQSLPNDFFVEAHTKMLSSKVLRLSKKGAGQQLINDIASVTNRNFKGLLKKWDLLGNVLREVCNNSNKNNSCSGVPIYNDENFPSKHTYLAPNKTNTSHFYANIAGGMPFISPVTEKAIFVNSAKKFCPRTLEALNEWHD